MNSITQAPIKALDGTRWMVISIYGNNAAIYQNGHNGLFSLAAPADRLKEFGATSPRWDRKNAERIAEELNAKHPCMNFRAIDELDLN